MTEIRDATLNDAESILKIYDYYVKNTAITFEYDTPSLAEFQGRMKEIAKRYPYLVFCKTVKSKAMHMRENLLAEQLMIGLAS